MLKDFVRMAQHNRFVMAPMVGIIVLPSPCRVLPRLSNSEFDAGALGVQAAKAL